MSRTIAEQFSGVGIRSLSSLKDWEQVKQKARPYVVMIYSNRCGACHFHTPGLVRMIQTQEYQTSVGAKSDWYVVSYYLEDPQTGVSRVNPAAAAIEKEVSSVGHFPSFFLVAPVTNTLDKELHPSPPSILLPQLQNWLKESKSHNRKRCSIKVYIDPNRSFNLMQRSSHLASKWLHDEHHFPIQLIKSTKPMARTPYVLLEAPWTVKPALMEGEAAKSFLSRLCRTCTPHGLT